MLLVDVGEPETEEAGEDEGEAEALEPPDDVQAAPLLVIFFDDDDACGVFFDEDDEDLFGL